MSRDTERTLAELFEECAQHLLEGESIAACLARYPEHAASLRPLLDSVSGLREYGSAAPRDMVAAAASRAGFMAAAQSLPAPVMRRGMAARLAAWWAQVTAGFQVLRPVPVALAVFLVCVVLAGALTTGVVTASAHALPGDSLYGVKLVTEQARLLMTTDQGTRAALNETFRQTRVQEAAKVAEIRRAVPEMPVSGLLEVLRPSQWRVAGLPIRIVSSTKIHGTPALGAWVHGTVESPGDGRLVGIELWIQPPAPQAPRPAGGAAVAGPTETTVPTATLAKSTRAPSPPSAPTVNQGLTGSSPLPTPTEPLPTRTRPAVVRTATPVALPTATTVVTATASPAPSGTPTTRPTAGPTPRPVVRAVIKQGYITAIQGDRWTIAGVTVFTDGDTVYVGQPGVGDLVDATVRARDDGTYLALNVVMLARAPATPESSTINGPVEQISPRVWVVFGQTVKITNETRITGNPRVGDSVTCTVLTYADGVYAQSIEKLSPEVVEFFGTIEAVGSDNLTVFGRVVYFDSQTVFAGAPVAVGREADVRALQVSPTRLLAELIHVRPDTPTPTHTPSPTDTVPPTETPMPPPAAPTDISTSTATPEIATPVAGPAAGQSGRVIATPAPETAIARPGSVAKPSGNADALPVCADTTDRPAAAEKHWLRDC